jgi:adenine-specific DNA-methyltransferase
VKISEDVQSAQSIWALGVKLLGIEAETAQGLRLILKGVLSTDTIETFIRLAGRPSISIPAEIDALFEPAYRRQHGIYFTPSGLAGQMAEWLPPGEGVVVDPACGDGVLLMAAARLGHRVWGIESELSSAVAAALRLKKLGASAQIIWGDGLERSNWPEHVKAVIGNPPYVGEKGNKTIFDAVRLKHPDLADAFAPRMDLAYLFWWRSIELSPWVILLVSEYWLWADSAANLRSFMAQRLPARWLFRLGQGRFSAARGHHSLVVINQVEARETRMVEVDDLPSPALLPDDCGDVWEISPYGAGRVGESAMGVPLDELAKDQQGFVSGLDHGNPEKGFMLKETPTNLHVRPVLRASECVANRVFLEAPGQHQVVWVDGELSAAHEESLATWFGSGRTKLEKRREVLLGRMPWYRLHWPRRRTDMVGPKLVVPRRAPAPAFCLDLSGAAISSDCTYLLAPDHVAEPVGYLLRLMAVLNSKEVFDQLEGTGKRKGTMFEFYATPLKRLKLPCTHVDGQLVVKVELEDRVLTCLKSLANPVSGFLDL